MFQDNLQGISVPLKRSPDGLLMLYDNTRSKWLSSPRKVINFGIDHSNIYADMFMKIGGIYSNTNGFMLYRDAVLTCLTARCKEAASATFYVRKNGGSAVTDISLSSEESKVVDNLNIDLSANDWLQVFLQVDADRVHYPILLIEVAWK